jgi:diguanylate cyclase (GGDEF)-like protein
MPGRLTQWLDSHLGISGCSEHDSALLRERFGALKEQLPWLHGMLLASLVGIVLALGRHPLVSRAPAAILFGIIVIRAALLFRTHPSVLPSDAIRREIRKTFLTANLFFFVMLWWQLRLYFSLFGDDSADIAIFAGLAAVGASTGLSSFPAAARIPLVICALPFAALLATGPKPAHIAIGLTLAVVVLVRLRLIKVQDITFERLVRSRFTVEAEKKRAVKAEQVALAQHARVETIANTDPLTDLINRRGLVAKLDALPSTERKKLALILLDLDGFKPINDTFGHLAGDTILIEVSRRLTCLLAANLLVARQGGDEFAILCECNGAAEAIAVAQQAIASFGSPYKVQGQHMRISACAGVSYQRDDQVIDAIRRADIALYDAKRRGRGCVSLFSADMEREVQRRTTIEQALREPQLAASIQLLFQPIFELRSMELSSFEALARWRHPQLGWISPAEFIPITEQVSILHEISDALLVRAASAAHAWPTAVRLCFNLSPVQLCSSTTAANVLALIEQERLDPRRLEIEVTETALLADFDAARANLSALREKGVRIVLDDFGAGYSSIGYLREIKFDTVKLDGSLISSMTDVDNGLPLLRGVLELCRATGHDCVAEQIETAQQLHLLRQLGCRYGQGFGLCEPVSANSAAALASSGALPAGNSTKIGKGRTAVARG